MRHLRYETACYTLLQLLPTLRLVLLTVTFTDPKHWKGGRVAFLHGKDFSAIVRDEYVDRLMHIAAPFRDLDISVGHPQRSQLCHNEHCMRLLTIRQWRVRFPSCVMELPLGTGLRDEILMLCSTKIKNAEWPVE
jgi:hypothetical protein